MLSNTWATPNSRPAARQFVSAGAAHVLEQGLVRVPVLAVAVAVAVALAVVQFRERDPSAREQFLLTIG